MVITQMKLHAHSFANPLVKTHFRLERVNMPGPAAGYKTPYCEMLQCAMLKVRNEGIQRSALSSSSKTSCYDTVLETYHPSAAQSLSLQRSLHFEDSHSSVLGASPFD